MRTFWISAAIAVALVTPAAYAQSTFGQPVPTRSSATHAAPHAKYDGYTVESGKVVPKLKAVSNVQERLSSITTAQAQGAQVVTFPYSEHKTYRVPVRVGMFVTFTFDTGEIINQFAVSDPGAVQLGFRPGTNVAMLKLVAHAAVVGTIVTSQHIYYIEVEPAFAGDAWDQGVSWSHDSSAFGTNSFAAAGDQLPGSAISLPEQAPAQSGGGYGLYGGSPNFDYAISGKADFRPLAVWDNGRFTWIQFPKNLSSLPAVFANGPNGLEIVNYTVHDDGTEILVNRLMSSFVLKIGKASIQVTANR